MFCYEFSHEERANSKKREKSVFCHVWWKMIGGELMRTGADRAKKRGDRFPFPKFCLQKFKKVWYKLMVKIDGKNLNAHNRGC